MHGTKIKNLYVSTFVHFSHPWYTTGSFIIAVLTDYSILKFHRVFLRTVQYTSKW